MNFTNLIFWSITIITGLIGTYKIDSIQKAITRARVRLIYESRTETWGSPRFYLNKSCSINKGGKKYP